jgi:hypothetical protein
MVRPFLLAALRALDMRGRREPVMGTAHIPPGRRCFSLGDRHGGTTPSKRQARIPEDRAPVGAPAFEDRPGKASRGVNRKAVQDSSEARTG